MDQLSREIIFFNIAQIGLKPISDAASRRELSESVFKVEKGALCAELRPFYCRIRILVPMSILFGKSIYYCIIYIYIYIYIDVRSTAADPHKRDYVSPTRSIIKTTAKIIIILLGLRNDDNHYNSCLRRLWAICSHTLDDVQIQLN